MTVVDLEGPLKMFPKMHEFWMFADDAMDWVIVNRDLDKPLSSAPVFPHLDGTAVVRRNGANFALKKSPVYPGCAQAAADLKGANWDPSITFGILVGDAPKILVMAWSNGEWHGYSGGLVPWLKETLLVHTQRVRTTRPGHLDCECQKMGVEIFCVVCGGVIPESHTMVFVADGTHKHMECEGMAPGSRVQAPGLPATNPLLGAHAIIDRLLAQVSECRPGTCVVGSLELTMICGLARQALNIAESADRLARVKAGLEDEP